MNMLFLMNKTKDQISWVSSHDLYWENKMYKRKRSIVIINLRNRDWRTTTKNDCSSLFSSKDFTAMKLLHFNCKAVAWERLTESTKEKINLLSKQSIVWLKINNEEEQVKQLPSASGDWSSVSEWPASRIFDSTWLWLHNSSMST